MDPPNLSLNLFRWSFLQFGRRERRPWSGNPRSVLESTPPVIGFISLLPVASCRLAKPVIFGWELWWAQIGFPDWHPRLGFSFSRVVGLGFPRFIPRRLIRSGRPINHPGPPPPCRRRRRRRPGVVPRFGSNRHQDPCNQRRIRNSRQGVSQGQRTGGSGTRTLSGGRAQRGPRFNPNRSAGQTGVVPGPIHSLLHGSPVLFHCQ